MTARPEPRDLYLKDLEQQTDATWRVLDSAMGQRDLITKMHGAAAGATVAIVLFLAGKDPLFAVPVAAIALTILCAGTHVLMGSLLGLRMQQILLSHAAGHATLLLEDGSYPRRFFSLPRDSRNRVKIRVQKLKLQSDPMAFAVKVARAIFIADGIGAAVLFAACSWLFYGSLGWWAVLLIPLGVVLSMAVYRLDRRFMKKVASDESDLASWLADRFRDLRVPAVVDVDWSGKPEWEVDLDDPSVTSAVPAAN